MICIHRFFSFLSILGAFQFVFGVEGTLSIVIAVIPPIVYMIICFLAKTNFQITIAAIMSVIYAFLMTASFFAIIGNQRGVLLPYIVCFYVDIPSD